MPSIVCYQPCLVKQMLYAQKYSVLCRAALNGCSYCLTQPLPLCFVLSLCLDLLLSTISLWCRVNSQTPASLWLSTTWLLQSTGFSDRSPGVITSKQFPPGNKSGAQKRLLALSYCYEGERGLISQVSAYMVFRGNGVSKEAVQILY